MVEETINEIETREEEYKEAEAQREKRISKNERILRELCDQSKWNNIHIIRVPEEEEEREKEIESVFEEVIAENLPNLGKEIFSGHGDPQISQHKGPKEDNTKTYSN